MGIEELLRPRYELIADYPGNTIEVGRIIVCPKYDNHFSERYWIESNDLYPHLFKKLNWWERRQEADMPMYLRSDLDKKNPTFHKIVEWDMKILFGFINKQERKGCSLMAFNPEYGYFPATEQEYLEYQKLQTKQL